MDYITAYQKQIPTKSQVEKLVSELIILNTGIVVKGVKERWQRGESVNGGIIGRYSWEDYRLYKQSINPLAGGNVDLILTGALSEALTIRKSGNNLFQVYSTDEKYNKIGKQYGFDEFGLNAEQTDEFFNDLFEFAYQTLLGELWQ